MTTSYTRHWFLLNCSILLAALASFAFSTSSHAADDPAATVEKGVELGSLQVFITPPGAVGAKAQWNVDGGAFQESEATLNGLSVGSHLVCYQSVVHYTAPKCQTVTIVANQVTKLTAVYTPQTAGVSVAILPAEAVLAGAQWRADNGPYQDDGAIVRGLFTGSAHIVSFRPIPGWVTPPPFCYMVVDCENSFDLTTDQVTELKTTYVPVTGGVSVAISPAGAVGAGAQWQLNNGVFRNSSTTATNVPIGKHTVSFKAVNGWITPLAQTVTVSQNQITNTTGVYERQSGSISVTLSPTGAIANGAQWRIDEGPYQDSGATLDGVASGVRTLSFKPVTGYVTPANRQVTIIANQTIFETGNYIAQTGGIKINISPEAAITGGAQWRVDGGALRNSGATVSGLSLGDHIVSFTPVAGFATPDNLIIAIESNAVVEQTVEYGPLVGGLLVNILPDAAADAGGRWRLDGGPFRLGGIVVEDLLIGTYTISFRAAEGFDTPEPQTVTIKTDQISTVTGQYAPQFGGLTVNLTPPAAVSAGAQWRVDGGPLQNSDAVVNNLSYGEHIVSFKEVNGFFTPGNQIVFVRGNEITSATGDYSTQTGGLSVTITPAAAVSAGAQWQVDGRPFQNSGTLVNDLAVGPHVVFFKSIPGFDTPANLAVTVNSGQIRNVTSSYTAQSGSLTVTLSPAEAIAAGAQWQVDGGPFRNSGATQTGLSVGEHTLSFKPVLGFATPANKTVVINSGQQATAFGDYSNQFGGLRVTLSPPGAITAGAQWRVNDGDYMNSGATMNGLPVGAHTLSFKAVSGFPTPADKTVVVNPNQVTNATGDYSTQNGGLSVTLTPPEAVIAGAQWKVDSGPFQNSGTTVNRLSIGTHTLFFKDVDGFESPVSAIVTVTPNVVTSATIAYTSLTGGITVTLSPASAVSAGAQWQVDGGAFQNSGATVGGLSEGQRTVAFKAVAGFDTPDPIVLTVTKGQTTPATGAYTQQTGSLTVTLSPAEAVAAGATWRLDGGAEQASGATLNGVAVGPHTLSFTPVAGFGSPASQSITITRDQTLNASAAYTTTATCCAGGAPVKSLEEAIKVYLGDFTLFFAAMAALAAMSRFKRGGA